ALRTKRGEKESRLRHRPPRLRHRARIGRTDDGADARESPLSEEPRAPLVDELRHLLPDAPPVRKGQVLNICAARIRRLDEAEDARARAPARSDERLDGVATE